MNINYPEFIEERLKLDRNLRAVVDTTTNSFEQWINTSRLPFFTDYTDHGIDHLAQVIATAANLMTEEAKEYFTSGDTAVLVLSVLLHDSALHLSEAGFYTLIQGHASSRTARGFKDIPWNKLWDDFFFSAKRWDDRKLIEIFGEVNGKPRALVRDPFEHYNNLTEADRKLIGEFIRRNHPRMAHEFALYGVPGPNDEVITIQGDQDIRDISGLVARSHGLPLRRCLEYLNWYHHREYKGIHAVYLMTMLRIADYLQIQADRAPAIAFKYRHIPSKISVQEWKAHNAVKNITQTHNDPESIEIQARPDDVITFLRLKEWLAGIQDELDKSWAVLGEVYGAHAKLSKLGIIIRRVRSNLDDVESFSRQVDYVPERIELGVARPDLLKLLVRPLYDNIPEVGIRELMQNATDAVRERWVLQAKYPELQNVPLIEQEGDVVVWLDDPDESGYAWLTISDRGIGMTVDIIRDYFLTAGASFRNSDAWKKEFEVDKSPSSQVLRSGRFGIGVLAGFLLGEEMVISTRHIKSNEGISFKTTLDFNVIELRHDAGLAVGTTVKIKVSKEIFEELVRKKSRVAVPEYFEWFVYQNPSVVRKLGRDKVELSESMVIIMNENNKPLFWRSFSISPETYQILWSYQPDPIPALTVNGILITNSKIRQQFMVEPYANYYKQIRSKSYTYNENYYTISHPKVCIHDPDGTFPINLKRDNITGNAYTFESHLIDNIIDDYIAFLVVHCPQSNRISEILDIPKYPGIKFETQIFGMEINNVFTTPYGLSIADSNSLMKILPTNISCVTIDEGEFLDNIRQNNDATFYVEKSDRVYSFWVEGEYTNEYFKFDISEEEFKLFNLISLAILCKNRRSQSFLRREYERFSPLDIQNINTARFFVPKTYKSKLVNPEEWISERNAKISDEYFNKRHTSSRRRYDAIPEPKIASRDQLGEDIKRFQTVGELWELEDEFGRLCSFILPDCPSSKISFSEYSLPGDTFLLELYVDPKEWKSPVKSRLAKRWSDLIPGGVIPFDINERKAKLQKAYQELAPLIKIHEEMKGKKVLY